MHAVKIKNQKSKNKKQKNKRDGRSPHFWPRGGSYQSLGSWNHPKAFSGGPGKALANWTLLLFLSFFFSF